MSNRLFKQLLLPLFISLTFLLFTFNHFVTTPKLPLADSPPELYSNQDHDDLRNTFIAGIQEAKESILLIIYALSDDRIIHALRKKSEEDVKIKVIYDKTASFHLRSKLGQKVELIPRKTTGLMHQKILVIDHDQVWLGSANMTGDSLRMHGNLVMGMKSSELATVIGKIAHHLEHTMTPPRTSQYELSIGGQDIELWHLPNEIQGIDQLVKLLNQAKTSIKIAMFTWTNQVLAQAVIHAKNRGVNVSVVLDRNASKGASAKIAKLLNLEGVSVKVNQGTGLLHHKFAYIDHSILVNGSANWTGAAFTKNDDCFMILHALTSAQKQKMDAVWNVVSSEATIFKE